jgi:hypothetical protein
LLKKLAIQLKFIRLLKQRELLIAGRVIFVVESSFIAGDLSKAFWVIAWQIVVAFARRKIIRHDPNLKSYY